MSALALLAFLAGLAGVVVRLRREFPPGIVAITVALLAGATPLLHLALFEPGPVELTLFAAAAWLAALTTIPPGSRWRTAGLAAWIALAVVVLLPWPARLWPSRVLDVLFSSRQGYLSWTPVAYLAVIGTLVYARRNRAWALAAMALLAVAAWVEGAAADRSADAGVVSGRMAAVLALLAPGLACLLEVMRRRPALALAPLVVVALVWNHLLMVQYTVGLLPKDEPVSFARLVRQQADAHAARGGFYPFAFPANAWFAWREGVPVGRYDLLAAEPRRDALDLVFDRRAGRFLLDGWDAPGMEASSPVWWIRDRSATLAVPLAVPRDRAIEVTVRARSRFEEPVVQSDMSLLVNGHAIGDFSPAAAAASEARFIVPAGQPLWRDGINKVTFATRGAHRADAADPRPPGPIARRRGNPPWPVAIYRLTIRPAG